MPSERQTISFLLFLSLVAGGAPASSSAADQRWISPHRTSAQDRRLSFRDHLLRPTRGAGTEKPVTGRSASLFPGEPGHATGDASPRGESPITRRSPESRTHASSAGYESGEDVQRLWEAHYSLNTTPSSDNANAIAIDSSGNIFVTGYSEATYTSGDFLTIKYSPLGDSLWTRRYNGTGNEVDEATAIEADRFGNVVVAGYSFNSEGNTDMVTLKYAPDGTLLWERRYAGPGDSTDVATGLSLDDSGNIFVAGYSYDRTDGFDYEILSYSNDGQPRWEARVDGEGHGDDVPTSISASSDGSIYATGFSQGVAGGFDVLTLRYSNAGAEAWRETYNGSGNGDDLGSAVVGGPNGAVVCGAATGASDHDFLTLRYDFSGLQVWQARYEGPAGGDDRATALGVDANENIYVTGFSAGAGGYYAYETIRYDSLGTEIWKARHSGGPNTNAFATAIGVNGASGITVTGYSKDVFTSYSTILTIRYDAAGAEQLAEVYVGQAQSFDLGVGIVFDAMGNAYVAGSAVGPDGSRDYIVIRYDAPRFPLWPVRFDATGNGSEKLTASWVDRSGNVYTTGFGYLQPVARYGIVTSKFDPVGRLLWAAQLDSSGADLNTPVMYVDADGNVYISALSYSGGSQHSGFVTAKYAPNGTRVWTSSFELLWQSDIKGIVADRSGNVYIAGSNFYQRQMMTIKYDASGTFQWNNSQNGSAGALSIDSSGNVVITGTADGFASHSDIITTKYAPSGAVQWSSTYNGPNNSIDGATVVGANRFGETVVGGSIYTTQFGYQFVAVCYDSGGFELWEYLDSDSGRSYTSPVSLTVTPDHRAIMTGRSSSSNHFSTLSFGAGGNVVWRALFDGDGVGNDDPKALTALPDGDVVVTGTGPGIYGSNDFVTVRYSASGTVRWYSSYDSPAGGNDDARQVCASADGYLFVSGTSKGDYLILRYDSLGNFVGEADHHWPAAFSGPGLSNAYSSAVCIDSSGSISTAGSVTGASGYLNLMLTNYSADGAEGGSIAYTGNGFGAMARSVAVDRNGNRYMTGDILREIGTTDIATVKYGPGGARAWIAKFNGLSDDFDFSKSMTIDDSSNVYVDGSSVGRTSGYDMIALKYTTNGSLSWVARYNGPANGDDIASAMKVDASGNTYVCGLSAGSGTKGDFATMKIDRAGVQVWSARYNGPANDDDRPSGIDVDDLGNVYVTGASRAAAGNYDYVTVKYDSNGVEQWSVLYDGPARGDDFSKGVVVDKEYHITVTGESNGGPDGADIVTVQYDVEGQVLWTRRLDGGVQGDDRPRALLLDQNGNCYVTGRSRGADGTNDIVTLKYFKDGTQEWLARYSSAPNVEDEPSAMALDPAGDLVVVGDSYGALWSTMTTLRYHETVLGAPGAPPEHPSVFRLGENFPNPFNPATTIGYEVASRSFVSLKVYNVLGEEIATLVDALVEPGIHSAQWNGDRFPSGVYFVRMRAGTFETTKKMVLVR